MEVLSQVLSSLSKPFKWWIVVAPWEQGLRVRLGHDADVLAPGIHLRIPFLDRVYRVSCRTRMVSAPGQTVTTRDGHVTTVSVSVQFGIRDVRMMFESVANPEATLLATVRSAVARAVSGLDMADVSLACIQDAATAALPDDDWGLDGVRVVVTDLATVRTYRLLQAHEYSDLSGLDSLLRRQEEREDGN